MTGGDIVAINSLWFWAVAILGIVAMRLSAATRWRWQAFASVNLLFLTILLRERVAVVIVGLLAIHLSLRLLAERRTKLATVWVMGSGLITLFVFHKTAHSHTLVASPLASSILVAIGFSYVALRLVEVMRAVGEGWHRPPSLISLINYLVPFHMLAAGPIQSYQDFVSQPALPAPLDQRIAITALDRVARGAFKKLVLAFAIQKLFLTNFQGGVGYGILEAQMTLLWLFLDFSAYSDIAIGLGLAMGVATPENFDRPFRARNLMEFWDRWHISLSLFIRRNLFFPIQIALVRRSRVPHPLLFAAIATGISFTLAGLWHGLDLGWFTWGLLHAGGLVIVRLWGHVLQQRLSPAALERYRNSRVVQAIATILTFEYVAFAFVPVFIFNATA